MSEVLVKALMASVLLCSVAAILSSNIVYALVALIGAFLFGGCLFISAGLEFLGYTLIIVYVGAIAILFLFVVMTIDIGEDERDASAVKNAGGYGSHAVGLAFFCFVLWVARDAVGPTSHNLDLFDFFYDERGLIIARGGVGAVALMLYTTKAIYLLMAGLLLLVAAIGASMLSKRAPRPTQNKVYQAQRKASRASARVSRRAE